MSTLTIRDFDEALKCKLRARAAARNRSMVAEARDILRRALSEEPAPTNNLADAIRAVVEPLGGIELPSFPRGPLRDPPDFS